MLKPENAAVFTNLEKYGTASKGAIQLCDPEVRGNFERSFTAADIDNIKWYPPVPAQLEEIEGKILDKGQGGPVAPVFLHALLLIAPLFIAAFCQRGGGGEGAP